MKSSNLIIPLNILTGVECLKDEDAGALLKSVYKYYLYVRGEGSKPSIPHSAAAKFAFSLMVAEIDKQQAHNRKISAINAINGSKGGRPKGSGSVQPQQVSDAYPEKELPDDQPQPQQEPQPLSEDYAAFLKWVEQNTPYIHQNITPMTEEEFHKLKKKFGSQKIIDNLLNLENRKDLRRKYTSLYRTMLNWCSLKEKDKVSEKGRESISDKNFEEF